MARIYRAVALHLIAIIVAISLHILKFFQQPPAGSLQGLLAFYGWLILQNPAYNVVREFVVKHFDEIEMIEDNCGIAQIFGGCRDIGRRHSTVTTRILVLDRRNHCQNGTNAPLPSPTKTTTLVLGTSSTVE